MPTSPRKPPLFIVLDGIDGCGKSTQAARLTTHLESRGEQPLHLREPGGTALGEKLRELLLSRELDLDASVETLLFCASRAQMLREKVVPALVGGRTVVCERSNASTYAYQAVAGTLEEGSVFDLLERWASRPKPDLTLVLDLEPSLAASRRGPATDRIEDKGLEYQARVRSGFLRYSTRVPNVRVVDASGESDQVWERVLAEVTSVVDRR